MKSVSVCFAINTNLHDIKIGILNNLKIYMMKIENNLSNVLIVSCNHDEDSLHIPKGQGNNMQELENTGHIIMITKSITIRIVYHLSTYN